MRTNTNLTVKIFLIIIISTSIYYGQNYTSQVDYIKKSSNYYWGEASASSALEAEDIALARLTQMISVNVTSVIKKNITESNNNISETVENIIKTYSTASLKNVKTISNHIDNRYIAFRYISKIDVKEIFNERKKLVFNMIEQAKEYEKKNNYGYALKLYYYSLILINSIPEVNILYQGENLTTLIPQKINHLVNNTKFVLISDDKRSDSERILVFKVTVLDRPANYLEFNFWDGAKSIDVRVKDGKGIVKLFGSSVNFEKLVVNVKYEYYECKEEISEVSDLWSLVKRPKFMNDQQIILNEDVAGIAVSDNNFNDDSIISSFEEGNYNINLADTNNCNVMNTIGKETLIFLELLRQQNRNKISRYYSYDSFLTNKIMRIIQYNNISVISPKINANINKTFDGWELRKIKVLNEYKSLRKQTTEYLILDFNEQGKLIDVSFGITKDLYDTFVSQSKYGNDWGNRQIIIKFIERYRTAFLTRDINVLDSIFSDEAVIIVGRVIKKKKLKDTFKYAKITDAQPTFEQIRYTKKEYLKRQKKIFETRKDIFLGFSAFKISRKNKQEGVYGVSMRQNYNSTGYSDEGYLFLLIDFNEELPQIYVRSWQPKEWDNQSLIKLANFNINK